MAFIGGSQFIQPVEVIELAKISEGQNIGYLGCGAGGYFTIPFAQRVGQTGKVYAVDVLQSALDSTARAAKNQNLSNIEYYLANIEVVGSTPIKTHSLDTVFLINVMFQNKKHDQILKEADRLLRKNGKLVIIDWSLGSSLKFGPPDSIRVDLSRLVPILAGLGYEQLWQGKVGDFHEGRIFKKVK